MAKTHEVRVPDIGDFSEVPVIEVLVAPGDTVAAEDPLVTLESDKASMDVPAPDAGKVVEVKVAVGDKVSEGDVLLLLGAEGEAESDAAEGDDDQSAARSGGDEDHPPEARSDGDEDHPPEARSGGDEDHPPEAPSDDDARPAGAQSGREDTAASSGSGDTLQVTVPDIGDFSEVPVIEVLVSEGQQVAAEDALVTLESDKASMDVPAPAAGTVQSIAVKVGDKVSEGSLVLTLATDAGESSSDAADSEPAAEEATPDDKKQGDKEQATAEKKAEPAPSTASAAADGDDPRQPAGLAEEMTPGVRRSPTSALTADSGAQQVPPHASPAIRRFARELGVDVGKVQGTGRKGRILKDDVARFVKEALSAPATAPAAGGGGLPEMPAIDFSRFGPVETRALSRIKKLAGANLHRAWLVVPHVTQHDEADITDTEAFRKAQGEEAKKRGVRLTMLAFLIKASVAALKEFPTFNSSLDPGGENLVLKQYWHIGIAVDTPDGLVVPVIRDADRKSLYELAAEMADLSARARDKKLKMDEMQGASFTISSLGGIGGTAFTPIVNAPEVAILGVSRSSMKPVWDGTQFAPRLMLPISLSYDHRVVDGAAAARFCTYYCQVIADIRRLLL